MRASRSTEARPVPALALLACAAVMLSLLLSACGDDSGGEPESQPTTAPKAQTLPLVRDVLDRHREALTQRYDAAGVGIGSTDPNHRHGPDEPVYLIVVHLRDDEKKPSEAQSVEKVPIRFTVSGSFNAQ